jgi:hypothetical protein
VIKKTKSAEKSLAGLCYFWLMTVKEFKESLSQNDAPPAISDYLRSLWYDAKGDWSKAHQIIQDISDNHAAWIHAYLHRKEGDLWNADYWYLRAGKRRPAYSLEKEWESLIDELIHF